MDIEKHQFILSLLEFPEETPLTEYKSAIAFDPRSDFAAKLAKHILGQANSGGGYIVIGFREGSDGKLAVDPALDEHVSRSYETTRLCQSIDSFLSLGQRIGLQVHKEELNSRTFPVISVQEFRGSPYFCRKDCLGADGKFILREGAIYIRDVAAKTVSIAGPEHWNSILKIAVGQKQNEQLEHLRVLLSQVGLTVPNVRSSINPDFVRSQTWMDSQREIARKKLRERHPSAGIFEVSHFPDGSTVMLDQVRLVVAAQKAIVRKTGRPIGMVMNKPEFAPKPAADGINATIDDGTNRFDYWALHQTGAFYFLRLIDEDGDWNRRDEDKWIYFDTRIWRVAEAFLHCSNLYRDLELPTDTPISIQIDHSGLEGRVMGAANGRLLHWNRRIEVDRASWTKTVSLGSIELSYEDLTKEVTRALFMLFEFWEVSDQVYREIFTDFSNSNM